MSKRAVQPACAGPAGHRHITAIILKAKSIQRVKE